MKSDKIWLDVNNFRKFEKTDEYKKILDIKKQIKLLDKQAHKLTVEAMKKHNIKFTKEQRNEMYLWTFIYGSCLY